MREYGKKGRIQNKSKFKILNNNKRRTILMVAIGFLILAFVAIVRYLSYYNSTTDIAKNIEKQLKETLNSINNDNDNEVTIAERIYQEMSFEIIDYQESYCILSVTAPDLYSIFYSVFDSDAYKIPYDTEEYENLINKLLKEIENKLIEGDYSYITNVVEVSVNSEGEIEITYELIDALYGGLLTLQQELVNNYIEDSEFPL